ncbi:MAG: hypothetical protein CMJ70_22635 [Planctomycetaceae bacterium]|nr:hypothetical protein [Planctomycetaceae bacterium]HAA69163.1 hypothetical protein [Planctomycetaceae bacterium]
MEGYSKSGIDCAHLVLRGAQPLRSSFVNALRPVETVLVAWRLRFQTSVLTGDRNPGNLRARSASKGGG